MALTVSCRYLGLIKAFIVKVYGSCKLITLNIIDRHVEIYSGTLMMMMVINDNDEDDTDSDNKVAAGYVYF